HKAFAQKVEDMPVVGTIASQFNDPGTNRLYRVLTDRIVGKMQLDWRTSADHTPEESEKINIIPPERTRYLAEISETIRGYNKWVEEQADVAHRLQAVTEVERATSGNGQGATGNGQ